MDKVKLMIPPELLRYDQWVKEPKSSEDQAWQAEDQWGKYKRKERDWFCLTPDLGIVVAITVLNEVVHQRWGLGKFPPRMGAIKMTKTLGIVIVNRGCIAVPESEDWTPFISFQKIIDVFCQAKEHQYQAEGSEFQGEICKDLFGED